MVYHTFIPKYAMVRSHGMSGSGKVMHDSDAESKHDGYVCESEYGPLARVLTMGQTVYVDFTTAMGWGMTALASLSQPRQSSTTAMGL